MGFADLVLPQHAIAEPRKGSSLPRSPVEYKLTIVFSRLYRGSLKSSEGGAGGVPVPHFSAILLCQATNTSPNVPDKPCLSICK